MGWSGSADTQTQVRLRFATREEAVAYAEKGGLRLRHRVAAGQALPSLKAYAENFRFGRPDNWTH